MSKSLLLNAAAGAAGGDPVYVDDLFSTFLYTGNGTNPHTITNGIDLAGKGGLIWTKARDSASLDNILVDTERATGWLVSNGTQSASGTSTAYLSFNSDGYDIDNAFNNWNGSSIGDYVSWTFRKQRGFFDVVTYTGNGTAGRAISHNLGSVPGMMIVKRTSANEKWMVYHRSADGSAPEDKYLVLNTTAAVADNDNIWNDTAPTSTQFTVGADDAVNKNSDTYVAYLFAHDAQDFGEDSDEAIIKCGSFTTDGAGKADVDLGFEPQWMMVKYTQGTQDWFIYDNIRQWSTQGAKYLSPNTSGSENSGLVTWPINSSGFKIDPGIASNREYIYVAIRRPHKPASEFAATDLFDPQKYTGDGSTRIFTGLSTTPDMTINISLDVSGDSNALNDRLRGSGQELYTDGTGAEYNAGSAGMQFDHSKGIEIQSYRYTNTNDYINYHFKRAPGFFDVVTYTGTGTGNHQVTHKLGVVPEMMWIKCKSASANWQVYHSTPGATKYSPSFRTDPFYESSARWQNTAPTSSVFTVGSDSDVNGSGQTFIAYLFASVDGISKVGSYSGSGSAAINVNCGFSSGARFVLIKRSDTEISGGTGSNWYLWDSERGIVAGDDPYLLLNTNAAQVTNTDYIDPLSSGFTVTTNAPNGLNASGGTYIFYAIA